MTYDLGGSLYLTKRMAV